ncbi:MAG: ATP-binding protein [Oscillospiraceae bacterium]|nr:ATP-binding protein [Oscillospiraceae bacterium]
MRLIIIAGMPATGKSTLARRLSEAFGFPILEKDDIKEEMFDTIGYRDLTEKRALDVAANAILLRCAGAVLSKGQPLIVVNNFDSAMSGRVQDMIDRSGCRCVTVFLNGDPDVLYKRYVARDAKKVRHPGHTFIDRYPPLEGDDLDRSMTREYFADRFEKHGMADFRLDGRRIDLDATYPEKIDTDGLIKDIRDYFAQ